MGRLVVNIVAMALGMGIGTVIAITLCKWIYNRTYDPLREYNKKLKKIAKKPIVNPPKENYEHTGLGLCGLGLVCEIMKKIDISGLIQPKGKEVKDEGNA